MSVVVLKESLGSRIENFDFLVGSARGEAGAIRVEGHILDHACVIIEAVHEAALGNVPKFYCTII